MARRVRLDAELVRRGLAPSRTAAQAMIAAGEVRVAGLATPKPASQVAADQPITVEPGGPRYASRGGLKLAGALDDLAVDPTARVCLDAGAAHGGFTDVLLRRGAAHVVAVDVAYGQLDWALRTDPRVAVVERTNVRHLTTTHLDGHLPAGRLPELVVADLSFISLRTVLPALVGVTGPGAHLLPMVKPQFEAGAGQVGKGGVVRDPETWRRTITEVVEAAAELGCRLRGAAPSRTPGPAGNVEFFLHLVRDEIPPAGAGDRDVAALVEDAVRRGRDIAAES